MTDEGGYSEVPRLEGWLTFPEAAEILGITKQMVHKMAFGPKPQLHTVHAIGEKPLYVVEEKEILNLRKKRDQEHSQEV